MNPIQITLFSGLLSPKARIVREQGHTSGELSKLNSAETFRRGEDLCRGKSCYIEKHDSFRDGL